MRRETARLIEGALWDAARRRLDPAALQGGNLTFAVEERSRRYTSERELLAAPLAGRQLASDLAARALFFTIADAGKLAIPLAELARAGRLPTSGRLRLLDLGAGCGAMAFGALELAADHGLALAVTAIDRDEGALAILADALPLAAEALRVPLELEVRREAVVGAALATGAYDLVTAGSLLNELGEATHLPLARAMLDATAPDGAVIAIEPALRETARALHRLRDGLLAAGGHVLAPCTRAGAPCPMLADERDWCHEERPSALPERANQLAVQTGLRDGAMKFAYLVVRHDAAPQVAVPEGKLALRVVSHPLRAKGKVECFACGDLGRVRVRLLRRHRGDVNRGFERARRGDVIVLDERAAAAGELDDTTEVELLALPRHDG